MTTYRIANTRTGRYVRFMCISDVLGYMRLRGRTIYNVRGVVQALSAGKSYTVGNHVITREKR